MDGIKDMDEVEVLMVRCMQGHVAKHNFDSQEGEFENCTKEMTDIERQTTYKKNINLWILSQPLPQLWIFKSLNGVQQEHQKKILRTSGEPFCSSAARRGIEGKPTQAEAFDCSEHGTD